jgi:CubicO group peptidase (beta-lactamase class C family)
MTDIMNQATAATSAWPRCWPEEAGVDPAALDMAARGLADLAGPGGRYRTVVVRGGRIVAEWNAGVAPDALVRQASAAKSVYSCLLGIAIDEGKTASADALVCDYYPEMLDVAEGTGPKAGRSSKPEDAQITFRHLITNTSGYLKPDERPGESFHYQTWGTNVLMHALGKAYNVYDANDPEGSLGPGELIREKIRDPIGGEWTWEWMN